MINEETKRVNISNGVEVLRVTEFKAMQMVAENGYHYTSKKKLKAAVKADKKQHLKETMYKNKILAKKKARLKHAQSLEMH